MGNSNRIEKYVATTCLLYQYGCMHIVGLGTVVTRSFVEVEGN